MRKVPVGRTLESPIGQTLSGWPAGRVGRKHGIKLILLHSVAARRILASTQLAQKPSPAMTVLVPGILLTAIAWLAAWGRFGIVTEFSFFPLWIGYILVLNGVSEVLLRDSLIRRMGLSFLGLFVFSVPLWWFFELMNSFVHNWQISLPIRFPIFNTVSRHPLISRL